MPAAIDPVIKKQVINQWLSGDSRDRIAADNGIGTGTVSNIIDDWKKGVQDSDYESIRELSVFCKKHGVTLNALASCIRLNNYIQSLGANANESALESLIANLANYPNPDPAKLIEAAAQISESGIPLEKLEEHVNSLKSEKETLQREIDEERQTFEARLATVRDVLPLAEQITRLKIGVGELLAFHCAVYEKADTEKIPLDTAAYKIVEDIRDYSQLGGLKKEQYRLQQQIFISQMFMGSREATLESLAKLQNLGVRDEVIQNMAKLIDLVELSSSIQKDYSGNSNSGNTNS